MYQTVAIFQKSSGFLEGESISTIVKGISFNYIKTLEAFPCFY